VVPTGQDLRRFRKAQRVSAAAVARAWGVDRSYIAHIERRPSLTPRTAQRYLKALDTAMDGATVRKRSNGGLWGLVPSLISSDLRRLSTYVARALGQWSQRNGPNRHDAIGTDDDDSTGRAA
jgi:transcriptional regulator with XRE-family HTH domain